MSGRGPVFGGCVLAIGWVPWFLFMSCLLGLEYPKVSCADTCAVARLGLGAQLGADPFLSSHGLSAWLLGPPQSMASSWQWLFLQRLASPRAGILGDSGRSCQLCPRVSLCHSLFFFYLIFILYWGIVDLQYCVCFRSTAK